MKRRLGLGIFGKLLFYMLLFLFVIIGITAGFFARQFMTAYDAGRKQQLIDIIQPLCDELEGMPKERVIEIAKAYHAKNNSIEFTIQTSGGTILYETLRTNASADTALPDFTINNGSVAFNSLAYFFPLSDDMTMTVYYASGTTLLMEIITKSGIVLGILLLVTVLGATLFAQRITNPIKKLASDTAKMSNLESVEAPSGRKDEIGHLEKDVHKMYEHLKKTIADLENEIKRERKMEENQRYFFSAASHELKRPFTVRKPRRQIAIWTRYCSLTNTKTPSSSCIHQEVPRQLFTGVV